jgi:hypothetical protein
MAETPAASIPLAADIIAALGDVKSAVRTVGAEIKSLEKEAREAERARKAAEKDAKVAQREALKAQKEVERRRRELQKAEKKGADNVAELRRAVTAAEGRAGELKRGAGAAAARSLEAGRSLETSRSETARRLAGLEEKREQIEQAQRRERRIEDRIKNSLGRQVEEFKGRAFYALGNMQRLASGRIMPQDVQFVGKAIQRAAGRLAASGSLRAATVLSKLGTGIAGAAGVAATAAGVGLVAYGALKGVESNYQGQAIRARSAGSVEDAIRAASLENRDFLRGGNVAAFRTRAEAAAARTREEIAGGSATYAISSFFGGTTKWAEQEAAAATAAVVQREKIRSEFGNQAADLLTDSAIRNDFRNEIKRLTREEVQGSLGYLGSVVQAVKDATNLGEQTEDIERRNRRDFQAQLAATMRKQREDAKRGLELRYGYRASIQEFNIRQARIEERRLLESQAPTNI